jgi:hypothetical protein
VAPGFVLFDAWEMAGNGDGHTWARTNPWTARALLPDKRIDYILVGWPRRGGAGHVLRCSIEGVEPFDGFVPSDHYACAPSCVTKAFYFRMPKPRQPFV